MRINWQSDAGRAFKTSLILHGSVVVLFVVGMFASWLFSKPVKPAHVFELQGVQAPTHDKAVSAAAQPQPRQPDIPDLDTSPPKPQPKPTPKPAEKPTAKPTKTESKQITYEEFLKQNKIPPKTQTVKKPKPAPVPAASLDTAAVLRDLRSNLSREDNARVAGMSTAQQNELFDYFQRVRAMIDANFTAPKRIAEDIRATVQFKISAYGAVSGIRLVSSSGNTAFDNAALAAVRALGTLPPPPGKTAYTRSIEFVGE